ncbi:MAG TPA: hypothetical protein VEQ85_04010, partial [Lacipirellulaceae bacterium]|nr:hypothetical protein [Lacipirellulaceae bacterium]
TGYTDDGLGGNFANRHDFLLSANGGTTQATFGINDSFTFSTIVTLAVGSVAPRKEAGIRLNSNVTGDALFIVNSDAGEIVAFGGGAPFYSFGNNGGGNGYVPGTPILLGITMIGGGAPGVPNTIEYFIDRTPADPAGVVSSGPLAFSNLEGGAVAYNVGMYVQGAPNLTNSAEFVNGTFADIRYSATPIPEPASIATAVIGLLGLGAMARKRS